MKSIICLIAVACAVVAASAKPSTPDIEWKPPTFYEPYPSHDSKDVTFDEVKAKLNAAKLEPAQTYDLLTSCDQPDARIVTGVNVDRLAIVSGVFIEMCSIDEVQEERAKVCDLLDKNKDESVMFDNLRRYCREALHKVDEYCSKPEVQNLKMDKMFQAYEQAESFDVPAEEVKKQLAGKKLEPAQTYALLTSGDWNRNDLVFGRTKASTVSLVALNFPGACADTQVAEDREITCKRLDEDDDGSVIFDNLSRFCHDATEKTREHCANKKD